MPNITQNNEIEYINKEISSLKDIQLAFIMYGVIT